MSRGYWQRIYAIGYQAMKAGLKDTSRKVCWYERRPAFDSRSVDDVMYAFLDFLEYETSWPAWQRRTHAAQQPLSPTRPHVAQLYQCCSTNSPPDVAYVHRRGAGAGSDATAGAAAGAASSLSAAAGAQTRAQSNAQCGAGDDMVLRQFADFRAGTCKPLPRI